MTKQRSKAREYLIEEFTKSLKEDDYIFETPWFKGISKPVNAVSGKKYNGINTLNLFFAAKNYGYQDNRWCTFEQARKKNWKIKKGAKGIPVEFWSMYDIEKNKTISFYEYRLLMLNDPEFDEKRYRIYSRSYYVFNGEDIIGIPERELPPKLSEEFDRSFINNCLKNMSVTVCEEGDRAYYNVMEDKIYMPPYETFKTSDGYQSTLLHEICHSTGHEKRLNRKILNSFGTEDYAKEELRAEISSSFICAELDLEKDQKSIDNHKAYIQSWIKILENDPDELFKAISESNKIADYVLEKGEYKTLLKNQEDQKDIELESLIKGIGDEDNELSYLNDRYSKDDEEMEM